jgi:hypothetical protein
MMKKIILSCLLIIGWQAIYAQKKVPKNTIAEGVTATATAKYYNVKTAVQSIVDAVLATNKKDDRLLRYTVSYKDTPLGKYAEYRFVYDVEDSMYVKNLFTQSSKH